MRVLRPLLVLSSRAAFATKRGRAADGIAWHGSALGTAIEFGKRTVVFPPSCQRKLGSLFCFRRFVRRSEIPAFAGMTMVDGNAWSNVLGIRDEYQVESWIPAFAGMTERGGFQAFCPCRGGVARSVGRRVLRWREGATPPSALRAATSPYRGGCGLVGAAGGRLMPGACLMRALGGVPRLGRAKAGCLRAAGLGALVFQGTRDGRLVGCGLGLPAGWKGDRRAAGKRTPGVAPGVEVQGRSQRRRGGLHGAADRNRLGGGCFREMSGL